MDDLEAFSGVFEPEEQVTITFNGEIIFAGPFDDALPVLAELQLGPEDHVIVANEDTGPLIPNPYYMCPN